MSASYDMYPAQWGRAPEEPLTSRASLEELRFLESRGVDPTEFDQDERLARDVRSAERTVNDPREWGATAVSLSLETRA
jgi:hypothetical protein